MTGRREITIRIPLAARGKERARSFRRGKFIGHYTPEKTLAFEAEVKRYAEWAVRGQNRLILGPVRMTILCTYPMPKSWSKKRKAASLGRGKPTIPDGDNIQKALCDALNGTVFRDDSQVVEWVGAKIYGLDDQITITIEELDYE